MNDNIRRAFANGKAFIPFVTAGDPDLETTERLVYAMEEAGADLIELGIPFSDPTAEGPVIQAANERALSGGVTTDMIFDMVVRIRKKTDVPMVFMTYANVVYAYGNEAVRASARKGDPALLSKSGSGNDAEANGVKANLSADDKKAVTGGTRRFMEKMRQIGMDGLILPDVPFEEKGEFAGIAAENGLDFISLIAPTSHERIADIAKDAQGFVYCVSSLGVTGMRDTITTDIGAMVRLVKEAQDIPAAVGFGISNPAQARKMASQSDGVIVGSAIVRMIAEHGRDAAAPVAEYVRSMKDAVRDL